jgi:hypothetical protein
VDPEAVMAWWTVQFPSVVVTVTMMEVIREAAAWSRE